MRGPRHNFSSVKACAAHVLDSQPLQPFQPRRGFGISVALQPHLDRSGLDAPENAGRVLWPVPDLRRSCMTKRPWLCPKLPVCISGVTRMVATAVSRRRAPFPLRRVLSDPRLIRFRCGRLTPFGTQGRDGVTQG